MLPSSTMLASKHLGHQMSFPHCKKLRKLVSCIITNTRILSIDIWGGRPRLHRQLCAPADLFWFSRPEGSSVLIVRKTVQSKGWIPGTRKRRAIQNCRTMSCIQGLYSRSGIGVWQPYYYIYLELSAPSAVRHLLPIHTYMIGTCSWHFVYLGWLLSWMIYQVSTKRNAEWEQMKIVKCIPASSRAFWFIKSVFTTDSSLITLTNVTCCLSSCCLSFGMTTWMDFCSPCFCD